MSNDTTNTLVISKQRLVATVGVDDVVVVETPDAVLVARKDKVTRGDEVFTLTENQSTCIPVETKHRLENPGTIPLEVIEVQSGDYLGEDDIVRFEDKYSRK